jgi:hypothetical protein
VVVNKGNCSPIEIATKEMLVLRVRTRYAFMYSTTDAGEEKEKAQSGKPHENSFLDVKVRRY